MKKTKDNDNNILWLCLKWLCLELIIFFFSMLVLRYITIEENLNQIKNILSVFWIVNMIFSNILFIIRMSEDIYYYRASQKMVFLICFIAEIATVAVLFAINGDRMLVHKLPVSVADWKSNVVEMQSDGTWLITDSSIRGDFLKGPNIPLEKSKFLIDIDYECDKDQEYKVTISKDMVLRSRMDHMNKRIRLVAELKEDIENFQILIPYSGAGDFCVSSINVYKIPCTSTALKIILFAFIVINYVFVRMITYSDEKIIFHHPIPPSV